MKSISLLILAALPVLWVGHVRSADADPKGGAARRPAPAPDDERRVEIYDVRDIVEARVRLGDMKSLEDWAHETCPRARIAMKDGVLTVAAIPAGHDKLRAAFADMRAKLIGAEAGALPHAREAKGRPPRPPMGLGGGMVVPLPPDSPLVIGLSEAGTPEERKKAIEGMHVLLSEHLEALRRKAGDAERVRIPLREDADAMREQVKQLEEALRRMHAERVEVDARRIREPMEIRVERRVREEGREGAERSPEMEKLRHLRQAVELLRAAGRTEEADKIAAEAEEMEKAVAAHAAAMEKERAARREAEGAAGGPRGEGARGEVMKAIQGLTEEVKALRAEVKELRELIEKK